MHKAVLGIAAAALLAAGAVGARAEAVGVQAEPCAGLSPWPPEAVVASMLAAAKAKAEHLPPPAQSPQVAASYRRWQETQLLQDFAGLCHYREANRKLPPATARRVVFFGDSITELWAAREPTLFSGDVIDRGVSGQTTAQMVGRFQEDVVALHPRVAHILAGTNDIAGNTGPTTLPWIEANIRTMVELAKAHHIAVVLAAVLPTERYDWRPEVDPAPSIQALNAWLRRYAQDEHLVFVDYGPALSDGGHGLKPAYSDDGVHPNAAGYAAMRPLAERAVRQALGR